jgi:hypothetical protein
VKLTWNGEAGMECRELGEATGTGDELVPGATYTVPDELGEQLLRSHAGWKQVKAEKKAKA